MTSRHLRARAAQHTDTDRLGGADPTVAQDSIRVEIHVPVAELARVRQLLGLGDLEISKTKKAEAHADGPRLTVEQTAAELHCSTRQVRRYLATGALRGTRLGSGRSRVLVERASVERLIARSQGREVACERQ